MPGIWELADLITPMAIRTAAHLRLADHLAKAPRAASDLAELTATDEDALTRLLAHLVHIGVLERSGDRYHLTDLGDPLRDDHPDGFRAFADPASMIGRGDLALIHLPHSVKTGEAAYPRLYGADFWADARAQAADYDHQMGLDVSADAPDIADAFDWGSLGHVVDVGGGDGTLLEVLLDRFPELTGQVFDQPATAATAARRLERFGPRASAVAGSFFEKVPAKAGGYLLTAIVHDWDEPKSIAILRTVAEAAGPGGRVFVIEKVTGDQVGTRMNLRILVYMTGKERGVTELAALGTTAGLDHVATHASGSMSVVEFRVP
ncbi:methyltransferase [Herbidospora mongoliensis]|uniref:methyltransferase n=1 Tax=Herbidospora mongoliensis TaxID=688067 RepID=UPI0008375D55|nr:methyltransferase [Herbidospora mongoliensis]